MNALHTGPVPTGPVDFWQDHEHWYDTVSHLTLQDTSLSPSCCSVLCNMITYDISSSSVIYDNGFEVSSSIYLSMTLNLKQSVTKTKNPSLAKSFQFILKKPYKSLFFVNDIKQIILLKMHHFLFEDSKLKFGDFLIPLTFK